MVAMPGILLRPGAARNRENARQQPFLPENNLRGMVHPAHVLNTALQLFFSPSPIVSAMNPRFMLTQAEADFLHSLEKQFETTGVHPPALPPSDFQLP